MKSFRLRLVVSVSMAVAVLLAVVSGFAHVRISRWNLAKLDDLLHDKVAILANSTGHGDITYVAPLERELEQTRYGYFIQCFDTNGVYVWAHPLHGEAIPLTPETMERCRDLLAFGYETFDHPRLGELRTVAYPLWHYDEGEPRVFGYVQVVQPMNLVHQTGSRIVLGLVLGSLLVVAGCAALLWWISGRWLESVNGLGRMARELAGQEVPHGRLPVSENDSELAEFARACNLLLERLETSYASRQRFIADAAHELRTPLTILLGEIDVALRRVREPGRYQAVLTSNREEIVRLTRLTNNLLVLARADAGSALEPLRSVRLREAVSAVADQLRSTAEQRRIDLRVEGDEGLFAQADPAAFQRIVFNLAENAVRHSPEDEPVTLRVSRDGDDALVEVSDLGAGIAADQQARIFERFFQVRPTTTGTGLGLAIVKALVEAHGGRVEVRSTLGVGTTFSVRLPLVDR